MAFIRYRKLVLDENGNVQSGSAAIIDVKYNPDNKVNHSQQIVREKLGKVVMYAGKVIERGTASEIFHNPLHPYTIGLQKSKPLITSNVKEPLYSIPGQVPNPINLPNNCYFKNRCNMACEKCKGEYPREIRVSPTHVVSCWLYDKK